MNKKNKTSTIYYVVISILLCIFLWYSLQKHQCSSLLDITDIDSELVGRKPDIHVRDVTIEWFFSKKPMDMRKASLFENLKIDAAKVYSLLTATRWLLGSCEIVQNNGANGLKREWKGDIPENINGDIFIPVSAANGDEKHLGLLLHRIIPLAIYKVIYKTILENKGIEQAEKVKLKWVNDVLVNGKKICGFKPDDFGSTDKVISFQFGVNVNMPEKELEKIDQPATSLSVECGKHINHEDILKEIVIEIVKLFQFYKENLDGLDKDFSSKMAFIGEEVIVYDYDGPGTKLEGILYKVSGGKVFIVNPKTKEMTFVLPGQGLLKSKKLMKEKSEKLK